MIAPRIAGLDVTTITTMMRATNVMITGNGVAMLTTLTGATKREITL
jgi:hypothetical protein